jgi:hypothetical protein
LWIPAFPKGMPSARGNDIVGLCPLLRSKSFITPSRLKNLTQQNIQKGILLNEQTV